MLNDQSKNEHITEFIHFHSFRFVSNFHFDRSIDAKGRTTRKEGSVINNIGVKKKREWRK